MTMHVKDAATHKTVNQLSVKDAATWKTVQTGYVKDAGTWKPFHVNAVVNITDNFNVRRDGAAGSPKTATFIVKANGEVHWNSSVSTDATGLQQNWVTPTSAGGADYDVKVTLTSGSFTTGTTGSFLSLGSDRTWTITRSSAGASTANFLCEIRLASSGVVQDSANFSMIVDLV